MWVRDTTEGYIKGFVSEIGPAKFKVTPLDSERNFTDRNYLCDETYPAREQPEDQEDNCKY